MVFETIPFDIAFPVASITALIVESALITLAIALADFAISHGIELKRILMMSGLAYLLVPIVGSLLGSYLPALTIYLLPLLVWVILGEIFLKELDFRKKAIVAGLGYIIFLIFGIIQLPGIIISLLAF